MAPVDGHACHLIQWEPLVVIGGVLVQRDRLGCQPEPVGAGKALHLLAPRMFLLWDNTIAWKYDCTLSGAPGSAARYEKFIQKMETVLASLTEEQSLEDLEDELNSRARFPKPILKYIDEYNYSRYTYGWID